VRGATTYHPTPNQALLVPASSVRAGFWAQRAVCGLATLGSWRVYHPWLSVRSSAGFPDLVLVHREPGPPVIYVELKLDGKQPTPAQKSWLAALSQATGTEVHCWRPADWPAIAARLLQGVCSGYVRKPVIGLAAADVRVVSWDDRRGG
jgi:hypothetical protein